MNQRDALLILFEATAELPDTRSMRQARRWAEKRLEVLRIRYGRMAEARERRRLEGVRRFFQAGWGRFCSEGHWQRYSARGERPGIYAARRLLAAQDALLKHLKEASSC